MTECNYYKGSALVEEQIKTPNTTNLTYGINKQNDIIVN